MNLGVKFLQDMVVSWHTDIWQNCTSRPSEIYCRCARTVHDSKIIQYNPLDHRWQKTTTTDNPIDWQQKESDKLWCPFSQQVRNWRELSPLDKEHPQSNAQCLPHGERLKTNPWDQKWDLFSLLFLHEALAAPACGARQDKKGIKIERKEKTCSVCGWQPCLQRTSLQNYKKKQQTHLELAGEFSKDTKSTFLAQKSIAFLCTNIKYVEHKIIIQYNLWLFQRKLIGYKHNKTCTVSLVNMAKR